MKVGTYNKINEYMTIYHNPSQGHSLIFVQGHSYSIFSNFFSYQKLGRLKPFIWHLYGMLGWKFVQMFRVTWTRWLPGLYMIKKISFFGTQGLMTLKLGIQYWAGIFLANNQRGLFQWKLHFSTNFNTAPYHHLSIEKSPWWWCSEFIGAILKIKQCVCLAQGPF